MSLISLAAEVVSVDANRRAGGVFKRKVGNRCLAQQFGGHRFARLFDARSLVEREIKLLKAISPFA